MATAQRELVAFDVCHVERLHDQRRSRHLGHGDPGVGDIEAPRVRNRVQFDAVVRPDRLQNAVDECQSRVSAVLKRLADLRSIEASVASDSPGLTR